MDFCCNQYKCLFNFSFFTDQNTGWAVGEIGKILKTTDGGEHWATQASEAYEWLSSVYFVNQNVGWAVGGYGGPYNGRIIKTTNGGENWSSQQSGTTNILNSVYFINQDTGWIVGSGGIILKTTNGGITFIEEEQIYETTTEFLLSQNYPNPFNPATKIKYSIPQSSQVIIKVYDILGSLIETLVNEEKPAGTFELTWNASNLPSGVYFYQLKTGEFINIKKMILLK